MKNSNYHSSDLATVLTRPELSSMGKLVKLYSTFFEAVNTVSTITIELQKHFATGCIPLPILKEQAKEIEKVIGTLGNITLAIEPPIDEIAIVQEMQEKLHLTKPNEINYLEKQVYKLVKDISASYKDKNLNSYLNYLKEKAWRLLEALTEYAKKEYSYSSEL